MFLSYHDIMEAFIAIIVTKDSSSLTFHIFGSKMGQF